MAKGFKTGGRKANTPNKATVEVRALAAEYGPAAIAELGRLATEADIHATRVSACNSILDRSYGRAPAGRLLTLGDFPDTTTPDGVINAVAAVIRATVGGELLPSEASDLVSIIDAQRRAIELGDHEQRIKQLEKRLQ